MKKQLIFLILYLIGTPAVYAQGITSTVDKQKILIGEQIKLQLQGSFARGHEAWPVIDSIPHFDIIQKAKVDTQQDANTITLSQQITLTSWDSGRWVLAVMPTAGHKAKPIIIDVGYTPFDVKQPYNDIKDIIEVKRPQENKWWWYLIFLLVLTGLFILFFPRGKKKEKPAFVPDEGAYKEALRKLNQLNDRTDVDVKLFYTELIDIFRSYLKKRKNLDTFSKTTDDLALQIDNLQLERSQSAATLQVLRLSDLVKYARFIPPVEEQKQAIDIMKQSILSIEEKSGITTENKK
ncbi:MAG TPA: hypothetical protein VNS32_18360 [Flavisolibacter sp.]|nr:hypothetical protein [Flavisolibacter sp.]